MFVKEIIIQENQRLKERFYKLVFESKDIATHSKPGQFLHIQVYPAIHPLLRRPFSIYRIKDHFVEIVYEVVGEGTHILSQRKKGEKINCHGPLGSSFSENIDNKKALLVGGGIGVAPLFFLGERLLANQKSVEVILGFKSQTDVIGEHDFLEIGLTPKIATDDGSYGMKGFVTNLLEEYLYENQIVYTCGPMPMLKAVSQICHRKKTKCEVSIHNVMGCGFGVCLGCVFQTDKGYQRVCKDGPVFNSQNLIFA